MKLAVLLDPLTQLIPYKDTSIALIQRAKALGWDCVYFTQKELYCSQGQAYAHVHALSIRDLHAANWASTESLGEQPLSAFDIILMRKDPPFDLQYIYTTYALELAEAQGVLVANKPQSLRDANEKYFTLQFPQCCPETLVSQDIAQLKSFWELHQQVIYKPLEGMGGKSVFLVDEQKTNLSVILEVLTQGQTLPIMAQRYIPEIKTQGDKRILLLHGKPVPYALARIPAAGELRGNLAAGATGQVVELTARDKWICEQVGPTLQQKGLYFVGLDVIGDYLTEINVTSPTCLCEISAATGLDIAAEFLQGLGKAAAL